MEQSLKQEWLISEIKNRYPDIYVDSSNLYKILVGDIKGGKVVAAINEILSLDVSCNRKNKQETENRYPTASSRIDDISMEEVVVVKTIEGEGTEDSPYYCIFSYWTKGGKKIGEICPREEG